jgi:hypothetical protein
MGNWGMGNGAKKGKKIMFVFYGVGCDASGGESGGVVGEFGAGGV